MALRAYDALGTSYELWVIDAGTHDVLDPAQVRIGSRCHTWEPGGVLMS
ncbi:MAG TPA: hypothetical protein VH419_10515 [Nocardioidaceae bacterium]|jgi:hypothetical protein